MSFDIISHLTLPQDSLMSQVENLFDLGILLPGFVSKPIVSKWKGTNQANRDDSRIWKSDIWKYESNWNIKVIENEHHGSYKELLNYDTYDQLMEVYKPSDDHSAENGKQKARP